MNLILLYRNMMGGMGGDLYTVNKQVDWLLQAEEPWTRYRTLVDLCDMPVDTDEVQSARLRSNHDLDESSGCSQKVLCFAQ
ncbi:MAG: hypothetical protein GY943_35130 [Chloroflexi bacterium]|nr:hypothetical protein [Chloroflexota bacterium]